MNEEREMFSIMDLASANNDDISAPWLYLGTPGVFSFINMALGDNSEVAATVRQDSASQNYNFGGGELRH